MTRAWSRLPFWLGGSLAVVVGVGACSGDDDPVAVSDTISLKLSGIKEDDVRSMAASEDKNVNTEEGNPYAEFLRIARDRLDGEPSRIGVESATVRIHADTRGAAGLEAVFADLEVFISTSDTTLALGRVTAPTGTSVAVPITTTAGELEPVQARLLGGDFKVGVRGATVATPPADFDLKLTIEVRFAAYP